MTDPDASSPPPRPKRSQPSQPLIGSRRTRWRQAWRWALLLTVFVLLPLAVFGGPILRDHHFVGMARATDLESQQRGFGFIARRAGTSLRVHRLAFQGMFENTEALLGTREALERAGVWGPTPDPPAFKGQATQYTHWCLTMSTWALDDGDDERAAYGWQELTRFLPNDPTALDTIHQMLRAADSGDFTQHQRRLDVMNFWSRKLIADDVWSRWALELADSDESGHRRRAARLLAEVAADAPSVSVGSAISSSTVVDPSIQEVRETLGQLLQDTDPDVRLTALYAVIEWGGPEPDAETQAQIVALVDDPQTYIAATARRWQQLRASDGATEAWLRIEAVATPQPEAETLDAMMRAEDPIARALAAWWIARHRSPITADENRNDAGDLAETISQQLLTSYDDLEKMTGALLVGLTGVSIDRLREREAAEDVDEVRQTMRLALWTAGQLEGETERAHALLRAANPLRAAAFVTALHRGETLALDLLLAPHHTPDPALAEMLIQGGMIYPLMDALPPDAPGVDPTADESELDEAFERLRMWYRIHRRAFNPGNGRYEINAEVGQREVEAIGAP